MSLLSRGLKAVGKVAKKVAPVLGLIPGVGTLGAAAIGGLGGLASGGGLKGALQGAVRGGAGGLAGKLAGGIVPGGVGGLINRIVPGGVGGLVTGAVNKLGGAGAAAPAGGGTSGGVGGLIDLAGQGLAMYQGAQDTEQAARLRNEAANTARGAYASMAPVRQAAVGALLAPEPTRQDLSARYANPMNPFAAGRPRALAPVPFAAARG